MIEPAAHIIQTPGVVGGRPRIEGRRIAVSQVADLYAWQNISVHEIGEMFELTPAQVHAALSYYYDHQAEIEAEIVEERAYSDKHQTDTPRLMRPRMD
jgi:uncharacterized protein (DUF433 family)